MFYTSPIFVRVLPFAIYIFFLMLSDMMAKLSVDIFGQTHWWYAIRITAVVIFLALYWPQYSELNNTHKRHAGDYYLSALTGIAIFLFWIMPYPSWAMRHDDMGFDPTSINNDGLSLMLVMLRLTGAALVVPVMEELFWRSFLMRWLQNQQFLQVNPSKVGAFAFFSTAVLFAVEHHLWFAGLLAGLAYGWLYKRYGNLWMPVVAHMVTNGMLGVWVLSTENWQYW